MRRKALLAVTNCTAKMLETYAQRDLLPFDVPESGWSDYSMSDALALALMIDAANVTDLASARFLASRALDAVHPVNPFGFTNAETLYAALVGLDWPDRTDDDLMYGQIVVGGRYGDIPAQVARTLEKRYPEATTVKSMLLVDITATATRLLREGQELGVSEAVVPAMPADLTGYPDWLRDAETDRRAVDSGWSEAED